LGISASLLFLSLPLEVEIYLVSKFALHKDAFLDGQRVVVDYLSKVVVLAQVKTLKFEQVKEEPAVVNRVLTLIILVNVIGSHKPSEALGIPVDVPLAEVFHILGEESGVGELIEISRVDFAECFPVDPPHGLVLSVVGLIDVK